MVDSFHTFADTLLGADLGAIFHDVNSKVDFGDWLLLFDGTDGIVYLMTAKLPSHVLWWTIIFVHHFEVPCSSTIKLNVKANRINASGLVAKKGGEVVRIRLGLELM